MILFVYLNSETDKEGIFEDNLGIIFILSPYMLWVLSKAILMSTHNICFYGVILMSCGKKAYVVGTL